MAKEYDEFHAQNRKTWRTWLKKNHTRTKNIRLVIYKKKSGVASVYYNDAVEEALCFGWIDSKPNKRDDKSYVLYFAERKPKSAWSKLNKQRIEKLIKSKLMAAAGLEKIEAAKKNGSWKALDDIENLVMPPQLQKEFHKNKLALKFFDAFPPSVKKSIFHWVVSAKLPATMTQRISETVTLAAKNIKANQWKGKI